MPGSNIDVILGGTADATGTPPEDVLAGTASDAEIATKVEAEPEREATTEAEPEATTEAEPQSEEAGEDVKEVKRPPRNVPIQALDEERAAHKETKTELVRAREAIGRMEQTFQEVVRRLPTAHAVAPIGEKTPPSVPDYDPDAPATYLKASVDDSNRRLAALEEARQIDAARAEEAQRAQNLAVQYQAHAAQFAVEHPDYAQAYQHYVTTRMHDLALLTADEQQQTWALQAELLMMTNKAVSEGANVAERIYETAKSRGFAPALAKTGKMATLKKGAQAASTLGSGAPEGDIGQLSLERLASLEGKDFDAAWEKMRRKGLLG